MNACCSHEGKTRNYLARIRVPEDSNRATILSLAEQNFIFPLGRIVWPLGSSLAKRVVMRKVSDVQMALGIDHHCRPAMIVRGLADGIGRRPLA